jgi:hypothetical protein
VLACLVLCRAVSEKGILEACAMLFRGKKKKKKRTCNLSGPLNN